MAYGTNKKNAVKKKTLKQLSLSKKIVKIALNVIYLL